MTCDARVRPMAPVNATEVACDLGDSHHQMHRSTVRDYAYPGSATIVEWADDDRRTFHGDWPGDCPGCLLPVGHRGNHAT